MSEQNNITKVPVNTNVFSFKGRMGKGEYFKIFVICTVFCIISIPFPYLGLVGFIPMFWMMLAADVKRIRDFGGNPTSALWVCLLIIGWSLVIPWIPIQLYLLFKNSIYELN